MTTKSDLERAFTKALRRFAKDLPVPVSEVMLTPLRRMRWDFVFPEAKVAVEIQGGLFMPGRSGHAGVGAQRDHRKANIAAMLGYRTLFFGPNDLTTYGQCEQTAAVVRAVITGDRADELISHLGKKAKKL